MQVSATESPLGAAGPIQARFHESPRQSHTSCKPQRRSSDKYLKRRHCRLNPNTSMPVPEPRLGYRPDPLLPKAARDRPSGAAWFSQNYRRDGSTPNLFSKLPGYRRLPLPHSHPLTCCDRKHPVGLAQHQGHTGALESRRKQNLLKRVKHEYCALDTAVQGFRDLWH